MKDNYIPEGHKEIETWELGSIIFPESLVEAEIGAKTRLNVNSIGELKIEVYSGEGDLPHFHLFNSDKTFESCICIYSANYFPHGGKYKDKLSKGQCELLNKYLKMPNKRLPNISVWEAIVFAWETSNGDKCRFPNNKKVKVQPDYSVMINYKDS